MYFCVHSSVSQNAHIREIPVGSTAVKIGHDHCSFFTEKRDSLGGGPALIINRARSYIPVKRNRASAHIVVLDLIVLAMLRFASVNYSVTYNYVLFRASSESFTVIHNTWCNPKVPEI
jgi:hypothetical protein